VTPADRRDVTLVDEQPSCLAQYFSAVGTEYVQYA
jgi:hypothetical protein